MLSVEPARVADATSHESAAPNASPISRGVRFLTSLQRADGHWPGDYGGPLFLLPGLVIACSVSNTPLAEAPDMLRYLRSVQNADGGFGLHIESDSYLIGTVLNYVAMRLCGAPANDADVTRARTWIMQHGTALAVPTWGKIWLSILGAYEWRGVMPIPPELWLLPRELPVHPGRLWCHTRAIHLPVSYLYGLQFVGPITPLVKELRAELFDQPFESIDWKRAQKLIHAGDVSSPHRAPLKLVNAALSAALPFAPKALRKRALDFVRDQIVHEDETTGYLDIGPVSKAFHIVCAHADGDADRLAKHRARIPDYLWTATEGTKMQGYNGSQFWDTAFAVHAIVESGSADTGDAANVDALERANDFIVKNQVAEEIDRYDTYFRDRTAGAFPFSTAEQSWTVSDCTAKGITAALLLRDRVKEPLSPDRLEAAVDVLLRDQNEDGGWSEYEKARAGTWVEALNAAEVFGNIMIAYSYVETTSACMQALAAFRKTFPKRRAEEIEQAMRRGFQYLLRAQRADGGFIGCWGVCFTYGTWFGLEGMFAAGASARSTPVDRAMRFLLDRQNADGGWGESYRSCVEKTYVAHADGSQVVHTAWALLGLSAIRERTTDPAARRTLDAATQRAAAFIESRQLPNGDWPNEGITGVFNKTCMIHYDNYRRVMPVWALGRHQHIG